MKKPKLRELKEALKVLFVEGPATADFPARPAIVAPTHRGVPRFQEEECIGCGACAEVCPSTAIEIVDDEEKMERTLVHHQDRCIFCGQCQALCTTGRGIVLTTDYDLTAAVLDRSLAVSRLTRPLAACEACGGIAAPRDQLAWIADRLGPLAYGNPGLIIAAHEKLGTTPPPAPPAAAAPRTHGFRVLCAPCRARQVAQEAWNNV